MSAADINRQITEVYGTEAIVTAKLENGSRILKMDEQASMTKNAHAEIVFSVSTQTTLTAEHKEKRLDSSLDFLIRFKEEGDDMLSQTVTGDETLISHITPESKQQSMEWRHTSSPVKVKAKQTLSKRKIMATMFWDERGVFLVDFMAQGTTINSGTYCATLRKLRRALRNKRSKGVLFLHDNSMPHTSRMTRELIESFG
ncbi:histone-lysine N-methyltransferase SETMAR [Trichonephila clavipes]|nr:histone-lysine N-methyltransferase SETMAR [Trichonephila clavipes]